MTWRRLYYGLQLQLVVYLDAVMELKEREFPGRNVMPRGFFTTTSKIRWRTGEEVREPEDVEREILKQLRMSGLVNRDPEAVRHLDRENPPEVGCDSRIGKRRRTGGQIFFCRQQPAV